MSSIQKQFAKVKLSTLPPPDSLPPPQEEDSDSSSNTIRPSPASRTKAHLSSTMSWSTYFSQELYLEPPNPKPKAKYHVYINPPANPSKDALIVLHHGAGSAAMTWALCVAELRKAVPTAGILAVEAREHGSTVWTKEDRSVDSDLSIDNLKDDLLAMITLTKEKLAWPVLPRILLIGHSLGGAVVTHLAKSFALGTKLIGFGVIDVVEGSAMEALKSMQSYLATRPGEFKTLESAIEWHVRSRTLRNISSARASVPALFVEGDDGVYRWRTDLSRTEAYWENWFTGMSGLFLGSMGAKLLILAGTDRLDKELMIGQMQGKFQLHVLPEAGHFVQEDSPQKTAIMIAEFFKRNDSETLVLPPKVSELLAQGKKV